ncbi:hypothetical protein MILUP08_40158 [Micromonospora lupini str. Lupac 08]|uniref:Uncharacterized protein n=1 Tax=Micromonospora lupini str. Lupac 08 TaxID=1150864 RepID=I0LEN0_9ACTN|nr:hypothetical protein MILUP08_40158 [Micromonospora lupini str. Lupac 08]
MVWKNCLCSLTGSGSTEAIMCQFPTMAAFRFHIVRFTARRDSTRGHADHGGPRGRRAADPTIRAVFVTPRRRRLGLQPRPVHDQGTTP